MWCFSVIFMKFAPSNFMDEPISLQSAHLQVTRKQTPKVRILKPPCLAGAMTFTPWLYGMSSLI